MRATLSPSMKKIFIRLLLFLVALFLIAVGILLFSLNSIVKKAVETIGPRITKVEVRLGAALISPWSGSARLSGLFIGNPHGYTGPFSIKVGSISVSVNRNSLFTDTIVINSIIIRKPELSFEGTLNGNNLSKLMQNIQSASTSPSSKEKSEKPLKAESKKYIVKEVVITGGRLHLSASALNQKVQQTLPIPDIRLENIGSTGGGVSVANLSRQILNPLINNALREGANALAKQGLQQLQNKLQNRGAEELQKILPNLLR